MCWTQPKAMPFFISIDWRSACVEVRRYSGKRRAASVWGPVGRGESWLMDGFFRSADLQDLRRTHFHAFFRRLHDGMFRRQGRCLGGALDELLGDCRLLCFDEFHVHDIGDAMLITRLFRELFGRKITLVCTSNYAPRQLLPNPLYHERFLPAIRLIETRMEVLEVTGARDYRTISPRQEIASGYASGGYCWPASCACLDELGLSAPEPSARDPAKRREDVAGARGVRRPGVVRLRRPLRGANRGDGLPCPRRTLLYLGAGGRTADGALFGRRPAALHQSRRRPRQ